MKNNKGYTLMEMLVVIVLFGIIGTVASETIIFTLRGTAKADAISKVRNNIDYAVGEMEREIRGASKITSACTGVAASSITFLDQNNSSVTYSCVGINSNNLPSSIASSSASLTSSNITLSACSFTCAPGTTSSPAQVTINLTGQDSGIQTVPVTVSTQITLRTY